MNLNTPQQEILTAITSTPSKRAVWEKNTSQANRPPAEHFYKNGKNRIKVHPDQKFIDGLLTNNILLLNELYQKSSAKIKSMVLQNHGTEADAADTFQDALLSVYHRARTKGFVLTCPFECFVYLICKKRWMNELSRRKSHKIIGDIQENNIISEDSFIQKENISLQQARSNLVEEKLAELSKGNQAFLKLCWSGKSLLEVARTLNVTYGYARKKKCECIAKLMKLVKQSPKFNSLKWQQKVV